MIDLYYTQESIQVLDDTPHVCARCREPHYWFANRHGQTVCIHCAIEEEMQP